MNLQNGVSFFPTSLLFWRQELSFNHILKECFIPTSNLYVSLRPNLEIIRKKNRHRFDQRSFRFYR